jgi:hypothetical protein
MTFAEALLAEEGKVVDVRNVSVFDCPTYATCMGPTKVWFHPTKGKPRLDAPKEGRLLKKWKNWDTNRYSRQTQMRLWD